MINDMGRENILLYEVNGSEECLMERPRAETSNGGVT
jgi:hypothetical protein